MHQVDPNSGSNYRIISAAARDMMDRPLDEAGSMLSTVKSYLSLYRDPVIGKISALRIFISAI